MLSKEMLERFYVELTNPDELGLTDSRLRIVFDMAIRSLDAGWVSVEERLPEVGASVLYYEPGRMVGRTCHDGRDWILPHKSNVTHWMPLPEAPK